MFREPIDCAGTVTVLFIAAIIGQLAVRALVPTPCNVSKEWYSMYHAFNSWLSGSYRSPLASIVTVV